MEKLAIFDFESICVKKEIFKSTDTTERIGKHNPISDLISSNFLKGPVFICNSAPHHLVTSFIGSLEKLSCQSNRLMKSLFFDIETTIKFKLGSILENLTQRHTRRQQSDLDDCNNETCNSTQFVQIQKKQLFDLRELLERYCKVLPVFGCNSAKVVHNLLKSYFLPVLVKERNNVPADINKVSMFFSFKFSTFRLLDNTNFLGGSTSLVSFLRAYKIWETKGFFPLRIVWLHRQNAEKRTSPVWCFLPQTSQL